MKMKFFIITIALMSLNCYQKPTSEKLESKKLQTTPLAKESQPLEIEIAKEKIDKKENIEQEINRDEIIAFAKTFLGVPYVYAKQDPKIGFDCSGYINYIFKNYDIIVPRSSSGFKDFGKKINIEDVAIGDVLVFTGYRDSTSIGHLGIVCEANGLNSKFIHASSGKVMQVVISDLNSTHYTERFHHAVDVIKQ